eukprot:15467379-Alexandrium_andersonii.AAC.1
MAESSAGQRAARVGRGGLEDATRVIEVAAGPDCRTLAQHSVVADGAGEGAQFGGPGCASASQGVAEP